jgi:hypothetical protein
MAKKKFTGEFGYLISVKLPDDIRIRLDAELRKEKESRPRMKTTVSDVVRVLLGEALEARDRGTSPSA